MKENQSASTKNFKRETAKSAAALTAIFFMLVISLLVMANLSFGWFSSNDRTDASGAAISAKGDEITPTFYYKSSSDRDFVKMSGAEISFENLRPGEKISYKITLENRGTGEYTVELILRLADGGEVPLQIDYDNDGTAEYYYFGTQLRVRNISSTDSAAPSAAYNEGAFLVPNSGGEDVSFQAPLTAENLTLASGLTLPRREGNTSGMLEILLDIEFANFSVNQNAYQNFGKSPQGESCSRSFFIGVGTK